MWGCAARIAGRSRCELHTVWEDDVCAALVRTVNKLRMSRETLLLPLITRLETVRSKANGTEIKRCQIDKEIAVLSRQSLVIAELLSSGILDPVDFAAQQGELSEKISRLRVRRRECLAQSESDEQIATLRNLYETVSNMDTNLTAYDEDLIRCLIDRVTVRSKTALEIRMKGGLTVTEDLPDYYTGRSRKHDKDHVRVSD